MENGFNGMVMAAGVNIFVMALWSCSIINEILLKQQELILQNQNDNFIIAGEPMHR